MDHEELETLEQFIRETQAKLEHRRRLRSLNAQHDNIEYLENGDDDVQGGGSSALPSSSSPVAKLDSSIKKNSALVKRLKVFSESQKAQILDEIDKLNLTRFISEVAASILEAKLKLSDIPSVIEICTKLNTTYRDFHKHLLDQYVKYIPQVIRRKHNTEHTTSAGSSQPQSSSGQNLHNNQFIVLGQAAHHNHALAGTSSQTNLVKLSNRVASSSSSSSPSINPAAMSADQSSSSNPSLSPSKLRVDLRLLAEFIISGILPLKEGFLVLMNLVYFLMLHDKSIHQNANAILTFCKGCGDEFLGLIPKNIEQLATKHQRSLPRSEFITAKRQAMMKAFMHDYYQTLSKNICSLHESLLQLVAKNKKICKLKGEVNKEMKDQVEAKHIEFQKVCSILTQLGELLNEPVPEFQTTDATIDDIIAETFELSHYSGTDLNSTSSNNSIWDDDGTRCFYEDLLDLRTLFPNLQIKVPAWRCKQEAASPTPAKDDETVRGGSPASDDKELEQCDSSSSSSDETQTSSTLQMTKSVADRKQPEQYFSKLSDCVNRDMIDNAAIDFIKFFNSKFGRKKLIKTLFNVHRTRLDLLPFFARLAATIHPYVPSVGNELANLLRHDFRNLFKKKDQINIESKVKNVRFIGELVKFNLYPKRDALDCLKSLLSDFTHHHIEMTCNLLEVCGRVLYKTPESNHQLKLILEQMMRKKMLLSVDSKYVTMIENAYYFTNPPEVTKHVVEEPTMHTYIKYLLYECLNRSTIDKVVSKLKKLNWNDKLLAKYTINCMTEAYNVKFYNIRYLAALLATLNKDNQWITIAVVDGVVEDILLMMEVNKVQFNQRRIPMIRYFGELYNYRLSNSSLVLKILYALITYGVIYPEPNQNLTRIQLSHLDPPENLFRIKLVCDLLDTSGQYLSSSQERKKLDCYLLFFQRYYWCKRYIFLLHPYCLARSSDQFPAAIEYLYNDTIRNLRPSFQMATSYSESTQALQNFIETIRDQVSQQQD